VTEHAIAYRPDPQKGMPMRLSHPRRHLAGILAAIACWPAVQAASAAPTPPSVPSEIAVEEGYKPFLVGHAVGVQIYTCKTVAGGFAWSSATPRADLYDDRGTVIVKHFGGPSWQAKDGSTVVGSRVDSVTVDPTAIAWLLLERASSSAGPDGDRLTGTKFIQRIATTGGLPPAPDQCTAATAGTAREIPYTADYVFWKALAR
jgi:hypothetical protein